MRWPGRIHNSVFAKLLLVIIIAGILINLLMGAFFHFAYTALAQTPLQKNIIGYVNYLIDDLGSPPDIMRAEEIARRSSLKIRYEGPNMTWATSQEIPFPEARGFRVWHEGPDMRIGRYRGYHLLMVKRGEDRFTFQMAREVEPEGAFYFLAGVLVILYSGVLAGAYLIIRRILQPVKALSKGVSEVLRGNLDYQVPHEGADELKDLAQGFNAMTRQVRDMLKTKEQLLYNVSHELRSPLTRIKIALELLSPSEARRNIDDDVVQMEKMIYQILENARGKSLAKQLTFEKIDIIGLIKDVSTDFQNRPPGIVLKKFFFKIEMVVDPEQIKTVLNNILDNAVKFSDTTSKPVEISVFDEKENFTIQVKDHGIGIAEEEIPLVFEPFYRADRSRGKGAGGFGLGLSLCKVIMEAHRGKIKLKSRLNEGTVVFLFFPKCRMEDADQG
ncbi:MAG: hypothetical protein A2V65_11775 [Deltaproteobacteria bacterium RBG_13_49_15]|nr:MAG: hypothetical protein A2V65_11775 [Deltaproteobacteria bacterium RBG_13_49_15]